MNALLHTPVLDPAPVRGEPVEPRALSACALRQAQDERKGTGSASGLIRFAGYAALFGVADAAGDVILPGAFAGAIAMQRERPLPLFWQHRPDQTIGTVEWLEEDARGLRVIARIERPESRAAQALTRRAVSGLSFGYRARGWRPTPTGRVLEDIELFEVSLVTHPLQHRARVHFVS